MLICKSVQTPPWTQTLAREATKPVFPHLPSALRPYLLAVTLFVGASALMYIGDAALLRFGFSWALVSLLVIMAIANLWGARPAVLVLALSALYGAVVVPHIQPLPPSPLSPARHVLLVRSLVFLACGTATVWLTHRARQMKQKADTGSSRP